MQQVGQHALARTRVGFWRRVIAITIDFVVVSAVVACVGVPFFGRTGGAVRVGNVIVDDARCVSADADRIGLSLPSDFTATNVQICTKYFFGVVHDRVAVVEEVTKSGKVTYTRSITLPVDADGRVARVFYLDYLTVFILALYLMLCELRFGRSLGKRAINVRVQSLDGGPLTLSQAAIRAGFRLLWAVPFVIVLALIPSDIANFSAIFRNLALALVVFLIFAFNFMLTVRKRNLPWHDRLAGTEVVDALPAPPAAATSPRPTDAPPSAQGETRS